ncbi:elongation factor G [Sedimentisphaera salicampi]|uniref:Elongation factor G n=1 Tax=Sedimentisphaera salicampi TaxID=1941349 RepID=A0A1W6LN48_9BACT|nr:elongation factor G [Sedimentisphaera salicampi]ARN57176.1 Vegetative protein 19 [Sedimentisphaera salicampi]OXU14732.1 Vegetative protein 19 [Sedimentisphaera salicampi]
MAKVSDIKNVVLLGHGSSGKTTLVEAALHKTGQINRHGTIEEKNTVCDYDDEEKEIQHSIQSSIAHTAYKGKQINFIDSPGYPGFLGGALSSLSAAETALIVVNASNGIEVNTRRMYKAADQAGLCKIIVVNKLDHDDAEYAELVEQIQQTFGTECRCANLPTLDHKSVIDCVSNDQGESFITAEDAHTQLVESIIECDDDLMEAYLGGEEISKQKVEEVFVKAMLEGSVVPIVFTSAKTEAGIEELLEVIYESAPSPEQAKPALLTDGENKTELKADPEGPLAGLVFKVGTDPKTHMKYSFIRLFSGTIKSDTQMRRNDEKKVLRPGHILRPQGAETDEIESASAGDIICLAKIDDLKYGDLIHDGKVSGSFELTELPLPMFALALEPASKGDETKIGAALERLCEGDPCFAAGHDPNTKELVIKGLGEMHLKVMLSKMEKVYKVHVNTKPPKIPYKETITAKAEGHYRHKKQSGGAGQFGEVYLRVEPGERDQDPSLSYSWDIFGGSIPSQFETPVVKGIEDVMETGVIAGFPMQDIKVSIYDGKHHPVDSKEVAFRAAGKGAFIDAVQKAKPCLLEPVVDMEITVPTEFIGDITGDISGKRGRVQGQEILSGDMASVKALVPLSEVANYDGQLKSMTGGQGSYSMELSHYDVVPPNVQQKVIEKYKAEEENE